MKNALNLRFVFVQMLFALAVGQLALKAGEIINLGESRNLIDSFKSYHYVYAHLFLCVIILSTSWVGWQIIKDQYARYLGQHLSYIHQSLFDFLNWFSMETKGLFVIPNLFILFI